MRTVLAAILLAPLLLACGDEKHDHSTEPVPFALKFAAVRAGAGVGCTSEVSGMGPGGGSQVGLSDLRFYVSNLKLLDHDGGALAVTLSTNEFQYASGAGAVALIDLTGNTAGTCADTAIAQAEGTARSNDRLQGAVAGAAHRVSFDVGLPQALMKEVIATRSAEDAPSPLAEMYWSWASGYRHFVFNFTVKTGTSAGEGYVHVGSRDCGGDGARALSDRTACGILNTAQVELDDFDLATNTVTVDVGELLAGLDFVSEIRDHEPPHAVIGVGPGVACHSSPMQPDCPRIFDNLGLSVTSGAAQAAGNKVFGKR